jgi:hypothetical protein
VDSALLVPAGPPVHRYAIITTAGDAAPEERLFVGGKAETEEPGTIVSTPHGAAEIDEEGHFLVAAEVGDKVSVNGTERAEVKATGPVELKPPPKQRKR